MRFFSSEKLGPRQSLTPEGFLICHDVPIARTGQMLYTGDETPIEPGPDGLVHIERVPEEVFRAETIASFEGKPVTLDHPVDFVTPNTWAMLAKGVTQNVRRGQGIQDDLLFADLLIMDNRAIEEVRSGLREVSCGYEAEYEQTKPGRGVQRQIVGNHVALVERGRCGPRCAIGDKEPQSMSTPKNTPPKKRTWRDRLMTAFKAQDEAALKEALEESNDDFHDSELEEEGKGKTGDKATAKALDKLALAMDANTKLLGALVKSMKAKDSDDEPPKKKDGETDDTVIEAEHAATNKNGGAQVMTGDAWTQMLARAEILAPGMTMPTADTAAAKTFDAACACQRKAITTAMASDAGKAAVEPFLTGRDLSKLTADQVAAVFTGAAELMRAKRNTSNTSDAAAKVHSFGKAVSVADINARNKKFWADRAAN